MATLNQSFDAVVSASGDTKYKTITEALSAGYKSIYVRNGIYFEPSDIIIPQGGQLVGESFGSVYIVGKSVRVDASGGVFESSGTISIVTNSTAVSGVGTTFTNLTPGQFIMIANNYMEINVITDDINLTLKRSYRGKNISGASYIAQTMHTGINLSNFIVSNSPTEGVFVRGVRHSLIHNIAASQCVGSNFKFSEIGDCHIHTLVASDGLSNGIEVSNSIDLLLDVCNIFNNLGNGILIKGVSNFLTISRCTCTCNTAHGIYITDSSSEINILNSYTKLNNSDGIKSDGTTTWVNITSSILMENNGCGVYNNSIESSISSNIIKNNSSNGIQTSGNTQINGNECSNNVGDGIHVTGNNNSIVSNKITNQTLTNGICVGGNNNTVTGNISKNNNNGLRLVNTSNQNNVVSNQCINNTANNIEDLGIGNIQTNNITTT